MKVVDIAQEIYLELGEPSSLSIPAIALWVRSNVGALNNYIDKVFKINDSTLEIEQYHSDSSADVQIGREEKAILKKMYMVHYYAIKLRETLGAAASDPTIEVSSDGATVKKVNKNELSKTYAQARRLEYEELQHLIAGYKKFEFLPLQVAGDDTVEGSPTYTQIQFNRIRY